MKSFQTHASFFAIFIISSSVKGTGGSTSGSGAGSGIGSGVGSAAGGGAGGGGGGFALMILTRRITPTKVAMILATMRNRGIQICHFDGFLQNSCLAGVQTGGGVSGSEESSSRPISERLPLMVSRRVMSVILEGWWEAG